MDDAPTTRRLLAVDLGLRTGLAVFNEHGELERYRSQNYGTVARLRRGAATELRSVPDLAAVFVEGDTGLARRWTALAQKWGLKTRTIQAHTWRDALLAERDRRSGADAKAAADVLAREIIARSPAPAPTSLRHDAAEAICIGWWAAGELGWRD